MNLTILKLEEAAKVEREKIYETEWEATEAINIGQLPWETEKEFIKRLEEIYKNLSMLNENLNLIENIIKKIKDRE